LFTVRSFGFESDITNYFGNPTLKQLKPAYNIKLLTHYAKGKNL